MSLKTDELLEQLLATQGPLGLARMAHEHESVMTSTAVAGLVVRPSTTSLLTIHNGENFNGKSLVIDRLFAFNLVTGGAQSMFSMWYCMHTQAINVAKGANEITTLWGTGDGRDPSMGTVRAEVDATVVDDGWFPCGNWGEGEEVGVLPGAAVEWECHGRLVVRPKQSISLHCVAGTVNEDFTVGASWWRTQL
jgi:hypothetical protein